MLNEEVKGNSLVIERLGLHSSTVGDTGSGPAEAMGHGLVPGLGTESP